MTIGSITRIAALGLAIVSAAAPFAEPAAAQDSPRTMRLGADDASLTRSVRLGVDKSVVVELPRAAGDVLVSNPAIADAVLRTSTRLYIIGVKVGQANVFLFDAAGQQIASLDVYVEADLSAVNELLAEAIQNGHVRAEAINGNIVLRGEVASATDSAKAEKIVSGMLKGASLGSAEEGGEKEKTVVNLLTITGQEQVSLKVTIAEVEREVVKQFGISAQNFLEGDNGFSFSNPLNFPFNSSAGAVSAVLGCQTPVFGCSGISATIKALEETRMLRTLAEPTLTAVSGETAEFLAGGEFPIFVGYDEDDNGRGTVSYDYKEFGVKLAFTPVVLSAGRISLKVRTEVSDISAEGGISLGQGFVVPGITARRAETTVELPSGGAFTIAGLVKDETKRSVAGVPGLQKLPILGTLFSSKDFQRSETELVIIVTPYIVKPANPRNLARPDDNLVLSNDAEAYFLGRLTKLYGARNGRPEGRYSGRVGFAFD